MTIDEIKERLPDVKVSFNGDVYNGVLSGRERQFPLVTIFHSMRAQSFEFSWSAIERAINTDTPLKI